MIILWILLLPLLHAAKIDNHDWFPDQNVIPEACMVQKTQHFYTDGALTESSQEMLVLEQLKTLLAHVISLSSFINVFVWDETNQVTLVNLPYLETFKYSNNKNNLNNIANYCSNILFMNSVNETGCSYDGHIEFGNNCKNLIKKQLKRGIEFPEIDNLLYYVTQTKTFDLQLIGLPTEDLQSLNTSCWSTVDDSVINILKNIYSTTNSVLIYYEKFTKLYFPYEEKNNCLEKSFNISSELQHSLYHKHPIIMALLLSPYLKKEMTCFKLTHNEAEEPLPDIFRPAIITFHVMFQKTRRIYKRGIFDLLTYIFTDQPQRMLNLEKLEKIDRIKLDNLNDISQNTKSDISAIISRTDTLFSNLENEEATIEHMRLENVLHNVFLSQKQSFFSSLTTLKTFENIFLHLYDQVNIAMLKDEIVLQNCVLKATSCFETHSIYCRKSCFLTMSQEKFLINFHQFEKKKKDIFHISCFHTKAGLVFTQNDEMFLITDTNLVNFQTHKLVPFQCLKLTESNLKSCNQYYTQTNLSPSFIFKCIQNKVFATGKSSYRIPNGETFSLNFIPTIIPEDHFPLKIINDTFYFSNFCNEKNNNIYHLQQKYTEQELNFSEIDMFKSPNIKKFKNHVFSKSVRHILTKLKEIEVDTVHDSITSPQSILIIFVILVCIIVLCTCCCCPQFAFLCYKRIFEAIYQGIVMLICFIFTSFCHIFQCIKKGLPTRNQQESEDIELE